jgi:hypothetical protein
MQTQSKVSDNARRYPQSRIALYKAISIVAGRLAERLSELERNPIYMKGGREYDARPRGIARK